MTDATAETPGGDEAQDGMRPITQEDIRDALRAGMADFQKAPAYGLFFGAIFSIAGIMITWALFRGEASYWIFPVAAGFPLLGPFAAVGLYEVSRRMEAGEPVSWGPVLGAAFRQQGAQLPLFAVVTVFCFLVWIVLARIIFAVSFGTAPMTNVMSSFGVFFTSNGIIMLFIGTIVGAALAGTLFAISAVSVPMMLDKPVDVVTAMITSVQAVLENKDAMMYWAGIIVIAVVVAMLPLFIGMILVFPILGHTSWHVYRKLTSTA